MRNYYNWIKQLKSEYGLKSVNDLLIQSSIADPFYKGGPASIRDGNWFLEIWNKLGFNTNNKRIHLRRIHYQLVSQKEDIFYEVNESSSSSLAPKKVLYENTLKDWEYLNKASSSARALGLVDFGDIIDKKNPVPMIGEVDQQEEGIVEAVEGYGLESGLPEYLYLPEYELNGFSGAQRYYMEIWVEKSTVNDILLPLSEKYGISITTSSGFQTYSGAYDFVQRVEEFGKPAIIFYISDFDINGVTMPKTASRHIQFLLDFYDKDLDIKLFPVVLTKNQILHYKLPTNFIKNVKQGSSEWGKRCWEGKRKKYQAIYGNEECELDALEAIYPGELKKILKKHILHYYDQTLNNEVETARRGIISDLDELREQVDKIFQDRTKELQDEYETLKDEFEDKLEVFKDKLKSHTY